MQLRDIQYVLAVADAHNFSKAAQKVHVSQPALSQLILRLEDELGVKLFIRQSGQVALTEEGKIFCEDGRVIVNLSNELIHKMNDFQNLRVGKLSIAIAPFYQKYFLLRILPEFQKKHKEIMVRIIDAFSSDSETLLLQGQVDLAFIMMPYKNKSIKYTKVYSEKIFMAVPKSYEVNRLLPAPSVRPCTIEDLKVVADQPFIMYETGRRMCESSMELCRSAGFLPRAVFFSNSCEGLNAMIAGGMGIGFVPSAIEQVARDEDDVIYYTIDSDEAVRVLTIGYLEKNLTPAAREFIRMVTAQTW